MDDQSRSPGGDIARRAFDTIAPIQKMQSLDELNFVVQDSFRTLGIDVWVGFDSVRVDGSAGVRVLFGNSHDAWQQHYKENGIDQHEAMIRVLLTNNQPFFWSDVNARTALSAAEHRVMNEAADLRLREGFVTPIHNLDGSITAILLTGDCVERDNPDVRAPAHLILMYFGSVGRQLTRFDHAHRLAVKLSQRQLDCLRWVWEGKSAADIDQILGISAYTVQDRIGAACAKLGVRTRVQAITGAAVRGLFDL
jgi:DNA-binding CsgD family transcriptional regulator